MLKLIAQITVKNIIKMDQQSEARMQQAQPAAGPTQLNVNNHGTTIGSVFAQPAQHPEPIPTVINEEPTPNVEQQKDFQQFFYESKHGISQELEKGMPTIVNAFNHTPQEKTYEQIVADVESQPIDATPIMGEVNNLPQYKMDKKSKNLAYSNDNLKQINDAINEIMAQQDMAVEKIVNVNTDTIDELKEKEIKLGKNENKNKK